MGGDLITCVDSYAFRRSASTFGDRVRYMRAAQQPPTINGVALAAARRDGVAWYPIGPICNCTAFAARGMELWAWQGLWFLWFSPTTPASLRFPAVLHMVLYRASNPTECLSPHPLNPRISVDIHKSIRSPVGGSKNKMPQNPNQPCIYKG
jgi:hypothetical protein